jgi:IMP dehydrogenase
VDSYVPYAGTLADNLNLTLTKIKSTMCNCGALNLRDFYERARLTAVSAASIREGGAHDVEVRDGDGELDVG